MTTNTINLPFPNSQPINIAPQSINITTSTGTDVPILTTDINNSFLSRQFFTLKPDDFFPEKIKAIKEIVPEKVYLFTFNDNTKIKTIKSEEDPFDLEYMIYLAIAKKMYAREYTFEGVLNKVNELRLQKRYVGFAKQGMKLFKELQKAKAKEEEEKLIKQRQHERYVRRKKEAKERKRKEQINIIADAIKLSKEG